jgi:hypothetical protein
MIDNVGAVTFSAAEGIKVVVDVAVTYVASPVGTERGAATRDVLEPLLAGIL